MFVISWKINLLLMESMCLSWVGTSTIGSTLPTSRLSQSQGHHKYNAMEGVMYGEYGKIFVHRAKESPDFV
jgi:hypothetical protein